MCRQQFDTRIKQPGSAAKADCLSGSRRCRALFHPEHSVVYTRGLEELQPAPGANELPVWSRDGLPRSQAEPKTTSLAGVCVQSILRISLKMVNPTRHRRVTAR